ncbi:hypothetical protein BGX34_009251, partial [Mortierella sp. NVP85]
MIFGPFITSPRSSLSPQQTLHLAKAYLESAFNTNDPDIVLVLCHDTEVSLHHARRAVKRAEDQFLINEIGTTYIDLGNLLGRQGHDKEARVSYRKAEELGCTRVNVQDPGQVTTARRPSTATNSVKGSSVSSSRILQASVSVHTKFGCQKTGRIRANVQDPAQLTKTSHLSAIANSAKGSSLSSSRISQASGSVRTPCKIVTIPSNIFSQNVRPPAIEYKLPQQDERLSSTPQLAACLYLIQGDYPLDNTLDPTTHEWLNVIDKDTDEQNRLRTMATE